jgi:hypothetical protein
MPYWEVKVCTVHTTPNSSQAATHREPRPRPPSFVLGKPASERTAAERAATSRDLVWPFLFVFFCRPPVVESESHLDATATAAARGSKGGRQRVQARRRRMHAACRVATLARNYSARMLLC